MNWPLFWALALAFGVVIGNILLLKHAAKLKLPSLSAQKKQTADKNAQQDHEETATSQPDSRCGQKPNSPE